MTSPTRWARPRLALGLSSLVLSVPAGASGPPLSGRVQDRAGNGVSAVVIEVFASDRKDAVDRGSTEENGVFSFTGLPEGDLVVVATKGGADSVVAVVSASDRSKQLILRLDQSLPRVAFEVSVFGALPRTSASASLFRREDFLQRAAQDPGDVLRVVPGLVVAQHAGGGKSDQYLIRGFDADHGTDFALSYAGIPVNLVSHAHGQGYADLGFVIPETLEAVDAYKGPYFAELGNLATAGAAVMKVRDEFDRSFVKLEGGAFDTGRVLVGWSPKLERARGFVAAEERYTNGPFLHQQALRRFNLATRWTFSTGPTETLSLLATAYRGRWNASGQIPLREVTAGRLDRFGAVDPSEGGGSSRYNLSLSHQKLWSNQSLNTQFYAVSYDLELFSNFTFFARDAAEGDGILQTDDRKLWGGRLQYHASREIGGFPAAFTGGMDLRQDFAKVGLFEQSKRVIGKTVVDSGIEERNTAFYLQGELRLHPAVRAILGLRHDRFHFGVTDRGPGGPEGNASRSFTGPKASLVLAPWHQSGGRGAEVYLNYGRGFHSNDARSVVSDPTAIALAGASGYEVGYRQVFFDRLEIGASYWLLDLDGELSWVGDEGVTELSGPTRRQGPEVEARWRVTDRIWLDAEAFHSRGRYRGSADVIARAPRLVLNGGASFQTPRGLSGSVRVRHAGEHPLVEDGSVQAAGYTVADVSLTVPLWRKLDAGLSIENLFDADVKEAQTYFSSRLPFESAPVPDNHFTPGNPFTLKVALQYRF